VSKQLTKEVAAELKADLKCRWSDIQKVLKG
jgi:hypothetical protein